MTMPVEQKIKNALEKHPDWNNRHVSDCTGGTVPMVEAMRSGKAIAAAPPRDLGSKAPSVVTLADVRQRFDIPAAIKRELSRLDKGALLPEDELCRLTAGKDRNRFRRALDNNPQLPQSHRIKLRLDDSGEGRFFWGSASDIAEARRIYEM